MTLHRKLSSALLLAAAIGLACPAFAQDDAKLQASAKRYDTYCAQCHGVNRNGKGVNTIGLSVQPRDHSDTAGMSTLPATQMFTAIKGGGAAVNKSALMPAWGSVLTDDEINDMVDYLRHVCKCGAAK
jgi:cytochrome c oxidase cbb3-type subunit 3